MDELLQHVPVELHERFAEIVGLTDGFCDAHLTGEHKELCRKMAVALCQRFCPAARGKAACWASGIVHAIGWVNTVHALGWADFLHAPGQEPHLTLARVAEEFRVSEGMMRARSKTLRNGLGLEPLDPTWTLPSKSWLLKAPRPTLPVGAPPWHSGQGYFWSSPRKRQ